LVVILSPSLIKAGCDRREAGVLGFIVAPPWVRVLRSEYKVEETRSSFEDTYKRSEQQAELNAYLDANRKAS